MSENKTLCHPASVDSLSTSAGTEDHVSMGGFAARKALQVVRNVEKARSSQNEISLSDFYGAHFISSFLRSGHRYRVIGSLSGNRIFETTKDHHST